MAPRRGVGVPTVTKRPRALRSKKEETLGGYETLRSTTLSVWRNLAKFPRLNSLQHLFVWANTLGGPELVHFGPELVILGPDSHRKGPELERNGPERDRICQAPDRVRRNNTE